MMEVFAVVIKDVNRWIDSLWMSRASATERIEVIMQGSKAFSTVLVAFIVVLHLEDAQLTEREESGQK